MVQATITSAKASLSGGERSLPLNNPACGQDHLGRQPEQCVPCHGAQKRQHRAGWRVRCPKHPQETEDGDRLVESVEVGQMTGSEPAVAGRTFAEGVLLCDQAVVLLSPGCCRRGGQERGKKKGAPLSNDFARRFTKE